MLPKTSFCLKLHSKLHSHIALNRTEYFIHFKIYDSMGTPVQEFIKQKKNVLKVSSFIIFFLLSKMVAKGERGQATSLSLQLGNCTELLLCLSVYHCDACLRETIQKKRLIFIVVYCFGTEVSQKVIMVGECEEVSYLMA